MANGIDPTNPKKFKYTLDIRGIKEEVLFNSPDGWLETNIKYSRSKIYGGLLRSLTLPLKFVGRASGLLRQEFYNYGLLSRVNILVEKVVYRTWQYTKLYLGKLDFSQFSDDQVTSVTVNSIEKDITIEIDAYDSVQYAIPLDVPEAIDVRLTPLALNEQADFIPIGSSGTADENRNTFPGLNIVTNQIQSITPSVQNVTFLKLNPVDFTTSGQWFYKATVDTIVFITLKNFVITTINGSIGSPFTNYDISIYDDTGTVRQTIYAISNANSENFATINADYSIRVNAGQKLFLYMQTDHGNCGIFINTAATISLSYGTITPATKCAALRGDYIYNFLIQKMNGIENPAVLLNSDLLTRGILKNVAFTCSNSILTKQIDTIYQAGDSLQIGSKYIVLGGTVHYYLPNGVAHTFSVDETFTAIVGRPTFTTDPDQDGFVRQITSTPQILLSFRDFFQWAYAEMGAQAALGLDNGVLRLEELSYFYRQGLVSIDLKKNVSANSFRCVPNLDFSFNSIRVGQNDQQYDSINGAKEVNSEQIYTVPLTNPINELNLISPIRQDAYGIEQIRIIPSNASANSAASKSDNDVFALWLKDAPEIGQTYYQPLTVGEGCSFFSGVDASYYNFMFSPKHKLNRGKGFLASVLDKMNGQKITLQSGLKNTSMVTIALSDGVRVAEADPINISDLGAKIFLPYYLIINTGLEFNAQDLIDSTPYGEIAFEYENVKYRGFINDISIDAGQNSSQEFKLLMSPFVNMLNMIH